MSSFGFPAQAMHGGHFGFGTVGDLLPDSPDTGALLQLSGANELTTGFSGGPVVDNSTGLVIGMVTSVTSITSPDAHLRGLGIAYCTPTEVLRQVRPGLAEHQVCPYRGLEPFTAEHTQWFHGRETAVGSVLDALGGQRRMLLLLGPSGAGKSSLVQAGVLPALADGGLPGSDRWLPLITRRGRDLFIELEQAGLPGVASDGLLLAVQRRLDDEPGQDRLLLVIDQFEELLTQVAPTEHGTPDRRAAAVAELLALIDSPAAASVILIMRDDFYPQLAALAPGLLEAAAPATLNVPATLNDRELEAIITLPAQAVGLGIEDGLTARITTDIRATDPGNRAPVTLPPLELALSQLWERRKNGRLTHRAYEQIGGVTGSLATWCDSAIRRLPAEHEATAKHILTSLVRPADQAHAIPATRQQIPLSRLRASTTGSTAAGEASGAVFNSVLEALIGYRIITTRTVKQPGVAMGESTVELIHDALIRDWGKLREWVAEDHSFQVWRHRIDVQQSRYAETGMPGDLLYGTDLAEGTDWVRRERPLPPEITTYLTASQQRQQATLRRTRRINTALAGLLVLALIAAGTAFYQRDAAVTAQHAAQSRQLAAQSESQKDRNPDLSSLLAVKAWKFSETDEAIEALYAAPAVPLIRQLKGHTKGASEMAFNRRGEIAIVGDDGIVRLWNARSGKQLPATFKDPSDSVYVVAFSPDGDTLATGNSEGTTRLWDVRSGRQLRDPLKGPAPGYDVVGVESVAFSPDNETLAIASFDETVRLWDVQSGKQLGTPLESPFVWSATFSRDGQTLARLGGDGAVRLWDVQSGALRKTLKSLSSMSAVAFSPVANTLATGSDDGTARLWDVQSGKELRITFQDGTSGVGSVAFSPDGKTLAIGNYDGTASVWDVRSGVRITTFLGHTDRIVSVAFSPDGKALMTGSDGEGELPRLWDVQTSAPHTLRVPNDSPMLSTDAKTITTLDSESHPHLWDTRTGKARPLKSEGDMRKARFSPDGKTLVAFRRPRERDAQTPDDTRRDRGGTVQLWDIQPSELRNPRLLKGVSAEGLVIFSPGSKILATLEGGAVRLWDVQSGELRHTLKVPNLIDNSDDEHPDPDTGISTIYGRGSLGTVKFSPDNKTLATTSDGDTVGLWDVQSGELHHTLKSLSPVEEVVFSPDSKILATGGKVRLWDVQSGKPRPFKGTEIAAAMEFSPNSKTLITVTEEDKESTVRRWELDLRNAEAISQAICTSLEYELTDAESTLYLPGLNSDPVCSK